MSDSESKELSRFNSQVEKFLEHLHKILPNNKSISATRSQIISAQFITPTLVIDSFIKYVYPYKNKIMNKDESFFLEKDEKELGIEQDYLSHAIHLKELWNGKLLEENKNTIWKYFQVLILLAEKARPKQVSMIAVK